MHNKVYRSLLLLYGGTAGQDPSSWVIPNDASTRTALKDGEHSFVGNHWTDFSNNYGGCQVGEVPPSGDPENRHLPMTDELECTMEKCMEPLKQNRRYKVFNFGIIPIQSYVF